MEEKFDILDSEGNPTGQVELRSVVHKTGLWHKTVHIYFFRKVNLTFEFLVHLRAGNLDLKPNTWDTRFGGHLKAGQSEQLAVASEVLEETGLVVDASDLLKGPTKKSDKFPNREFTSVYFYEFNGSMEELKFNDGEVVDVKWVAVSEIEQSMENEPEGWAGRLKGFKEIVEELNNLTK